MTTTTQRTTRTDAKVAILRHLQDSTAHHDGERPFLQVTKWTTHALGLPKGALGTVRRAVDEMVEAGILYRGSSDWSRQGPKHYLDTPDEKAKRAAASEAYDQDRAAMPEALAALAELGIVPVRDDLDEITLRASDMLKLARTLRTRDPGLRLGSTGGGS